LFLLPITVSIDMPSNVDALVEALQQNDSSRITSLVQSGTAIHDESETQNRPYTPLQLAMSLPSPQPLRTLLTAFMSSKSAADQVSAVADTITQQLFATANADAELPTAILTDTSDSAVIARVERAIAAIRAGSFVVVTDGANRENEGDLIIAAEHATAERIAFMVNVTSGIICVGMTSQRCDELSLPQMVVTNTESHQTAFTVTVDYKHGTSTGISAADRALTIRALAADTTSPDDLARPGHVFPLRAREGGVLVRPGHTEASVDLARLAGCAPLAAMCEIVNIDGTMARPHSLVQWSQRHGLELISIADLIEYRKLTEHNTSPTLSSS
jgi:3,4-dihydroxy 2-butanone 4-phosphate synthase/GTP cyclohydrolase II